MLVLIFLFEIIIKNVNSSLSECAPRFAAFNTFVSARGYARVGACVPAICERACNRALGIGRYRFPSAAQTSWLLHQNGFHIPDHPIRWIALILQNRISIMLLENIDIITKKIILIFKNICLPYINIYSEKSIVISFLINRYKRQRNRYEIVSAILQKIDNKFF